MSETKLTAMDCPRWPHGAPPEPTDITVSIRKRDLGAGTLDNVLYLRVGTDTIEIWPAIPDRIEALGKRLVELSDSMRRQPGEHAADCVCGECCPTRKGK